MSILDKIIKVGIVLQAGQSLDNSDKWKKIQGLANIIAVFAGAIPIFSTIALSVEQINTISYGAAMVVSGVLNTYLTVATSGKVGLPSKNKAP